MMKKPEDSIEKQAPKSKSFDGAETDLSEQKSAAQSTQKESDSKNPKDCRDNCMHCGNHCIYLNDD